MPKAKEVLNELLVDVFNHIVSLEGVSLRKMGVKLSMTEVHILEAIDSTNIPTMTNIANKLIVTVGTLTTSVDKLVYKGYVERYNDMKDRRKVLLRLTEKSEEIIVFHNKFHNEMIENVILDMGLKDDDQLIIVLDNLKDYFRSKYNEKTIIEKWLNKKKSLSSLNV